MTCWIPESPEDMYVNIISISQVGDPDAVIFNMNRFPLIIDETLTK